ncbi:cation-transporting P-type ATPase [Myxococcota bacterium]|nr:cation-transporting P-type ATPase [Myxococcota bacterium]
MIGPVAAGATDFHPGDEGPRDEAEGPPPRTLSAVPGRIRSVLPGLAAKPHLARGLRSAVLGLPGVWDLHASSRTGTALLRYSPRVLGEDQARALLGEAWRRIATSDGGGGERFPWHAVDAERVAALLRVDPASGLAEEEAAARLRRLGANPVEAEGRSLGEMVAEQVFQVPVALLAGAAALSFATGALADAASILAVLGLNTAIGVASEQAAERALESLRRLGAPRARVRRGGRTFEVDAADVVPGDVLLLPAGSLVAADARVISSRGLMVNEAALTGETEAEPRQISPVRSADAPLSERRSLVHAGSLVTSGDGEAIAVATGAASEIGRVQALVAGTRAGRAPLENDLARLGTKLSVAAGGASVALFGIGWLRGRHWVSLLSSSASLAVAAVPEGLPAVATTTLALGMRRLMRRDVLVRRTPAAEALGSATVLCADKTGTITLNRMRLAAWALPAGEVPGLVPPPGPSPGTNGDLVARPQPSAGTDDVDLLQALKVACLNSEVDARRLPDGGLRLRGSPTETALLADAVGRGIDPLLLRRRFPRTEQVLRGEREPRVITVHRAPGGVLLVAVKGSPEWVLEHCSRVQIGGEPLPMTEERRREVREANGRLADGGARVLGLAWRWIAPDAAAASRSRHLTWLGLAALEDPVRPEAAEAVETARRAGIRTVMITGDQPATGRAIGRQLGLGRGGAVVTDAAELRHLGPEGMLAAVARTDVFCRVSPSDKLRIIEALRRSGEVVAMAGDGVNDGPALRAADVGVAMGREGTEVAREVADVVLATDDFSALVGAVAEGRVLRDNIGKALRFLLATNASEVAMTLSAAALGRPEPFLPVQLLWINLATDALPGIALGLEPGDPDVLERPPRRPGAPLLTREEGRSVLVGAALLLAASMAAFESSLRRTGDLTRARTVAVQALAGGQLLYGMGCRAPEPWRSFDPRGNPAMVAAVAGTLALQVAAVFVPPLGGLLRFARLTPADWATAALAAATPAAAVEIGKAAVQRRGFGPRSGKGDRAGPGGAG